MPTDILIVIILAFATYAMLLVTGVNQMRHAYVLKLGWDGYLMASVWLWIAASGTLALSLSINRIMQYGMPVAIVHASGYTRPFDGIVARQWAALFIGLVICAALAFRSYVMLRNVRKLDEKTRAQFAYVHNQMLHLTEITEQMARERQEHEKVKAETWEQFHHTIAQIKGFVGKQDEALQE